MFVHSSRLLSLNNGSDVVNTWSDMLLGVLLSWQLFELQLFPDTLVVLCLLTLKITLLWSAYALEDVVQQNICLRKYSPAKHICFRKCSPAKHTKHTWQPWHASHRSPPLKQALCGQPAFSISSEDNNNVKHAFIHGYENKSHSRFLIKLQGRLLSLGCLMKIVHIYDSN